MNTTPALALIASLALVACNKTEDSGSTTPAASAELMAVIDATVDAEPAAIHLARKTAQPGDTLTLKGWVMGNKSPFVEGRAAFILGDPEVITACSEKPDDHCATPWDNCCDAPEDIKRATATIQIVDAEGRVLKEGIEGVGGIEKLSKLKITGTVAEGSSEANLVLNATAIDLQ